MRVLVHPLPIQHLYDDVFFVALPYSAVYIHLLFLILPSLSSKVGSNKLFYIYGKSWRVGNASRNETNEILTVYLWKVWVFIPRRRIRVIWHSDQHLFWQSYWVKDIDREYLEGNAQTSNIWYFPRKETTRLQVSQHSWQKGMNQRGTSLILDYCQ